MKKLILLSLFTILSFANSFGQSNLWNKITQDRLAGLEKMDRATMPKTYQLYSLNLTALKSQLIAAPLDSSGQSSNLILSFPNPDGGFDRYAFYESPLMEKGLADQFPDIKTYSALGIDDPTASMRISFTAFGLHAMIVSGKSSSIYIDTYTKDLNNFIVYRKSDITASTQFDCHVEENTSNKTENYKKSNTSLHRVNDSRLRTYRLAVACTGEYATFHGGTVALAQSAIVVTINRVNLVYERDLAVRLILVANNTSILYTNAATDPFTNNDAGVLINESQTTITSIIGSANYDIGHTFSTGAGGLAGLGVICSNTQKARGVTGTSSPIGDAYDIDYVAHELGHQFGGNHTFNNSCGGNRNSSTAAEPGSGTTIMAYAGICPPDIQNNSSDYFHAISIAEMRTVILASTCPVVIPNGNTPPVVTAGPDYTIPRGTAFILKGSATDANNDTLTYCWEQIDVQVSTQAPLNTSTVGPNFRSRPPVSSPDRYMPTIADVITNNLIPTWEVVPNVARTMNFALTVRDNRTPNGGQSNRDDMVVTTSSVGPFLVSTPNTAVSWVVGTNQEVTWAVAGTDANGINASFVDILLSTDGGTTYTVLLASKVPNDGSETITVPNNTGTANRIMVRGYNHIFYDISNVNFTIAAAPSSFAVAFSGVAETQNTIVCSTNSTAFTFNYTALAGFTGTTSFSATGTPAGSTVSFSPVTSNTNGVVTMTLGNLSSVSGSFQLVVSATSGSVTRIVPFYLSLGLSSVVLTSPANNAGEQNTSLNLSWIVNPAATSYDVQVATNASFTTIISSGNVLTNSYSVSGLSNEANYFWRVLPRNATCTGVYGSAFQFTTAAIACVTTNSTNIPVTISTSGTPTVTSTVTIPAGATIADVNVILNLSHTYISDLRITITSPQGTAVTLFDGLCGANNDAVATFDDAGVAIVCGNNPAVSGTVRPASPLSVFNNQNSAGTWTLTISDAFNQDGGTLNSWGLNICTVQPGVKWTGTTSNDWSTASNWTNNLVPNGTYNIEIPLGNPILATNYTVQSDKNVKISGTGSLTIAPAGSLTIQGVADFGGLPVTLQSSLSGTASIGQVTGSLFNATNVTVERYIPARRAWRMLTAPLTGITNNTISQNWQGTAGQGVLLWSPITTMVGYTIGGNAPNIRKYNAGWQNITNLTTEPMFGAGTTDTKAFLIFPTGPFGSSNIETGSTATTLRPKGQLITGSVSHTGLALNTFHALANPYASAINPVSLIANNSGQRLWLIDPTLGTFGAYVTFDGSNWSIPTPTGNDAFIQSGQGFFVRSATATSFTISENNKVAGSSNNWFERTANNTNDVSTADKIRVLLYKQIDNNWNLSDGALTVNYANGANAVDEMDSNKISNFNESIMFRNNNTSLSIEHRALPQTAETQDIRLTGTTVLEYQLRVRTENYENSNLLPILEDTSTGTFTAIPLNGSELIIPFTGVATTSTTFDNRFRIVYQNNLSSVNESPLVVSVFPNPVVNNELNINLGTNSINAQYTITNMLGQFIEKGTLANTENTIALSKVSTGIYILNVRQDEKSFSTKIYVQ